MMVAIVRSTQFKQTTMMANGMTYLVSKDFKVSIDCFAGTASLICIKESVCIRLHMLLLDPGIWSYKRGLLERVLRHIRLHPSDYLIPSELFTFVSTHPFSSAVSKALVSIRAEVKRQVCLAVNSEAVELLTISISSPICGKRRRIYM